MLVQVASDYEQCEILSSTLLNSYPVILGFDTETTIGHDHNIASTVQLSTDKVCYIFQLYRIFKDTGRLPREIIKILQSPEIIKVGVDLNNDINLLSEYGITLRGTIDIQCIARTMMIPDINLSGLANLFGFQKGILNFRWNWDNDLNEQQIRYAANDAYISLQIYQKMISGVNINTNNQDLDPEEDKYLEWLKKMLIGSFRIDRVVNQTVNSYGPWVKKYTKNERVELAEKLINKFIDEGKL
jgi:ribonuclease D